MSTTSVYRTDSGLNILAAIYPSPTTIYDHATQAIIATPTTLSDWQAALVPVSEGITAGQPNGEYALTLPEGTDAAGWIVDWFEGPSPIPSEVVASDYSQYTDPGAAHVEAGVSYQFAGALIEGTYDPVTGRYTDPGAAHVESGVSYHFAGDTLTGTYARAVPVLTAVSPDGGTITILRGDDCLASRGRAITLADPGSWSDLTGATLTLLAWLRGGAWGQSRVSRVLTTPGRLVGTSPQTIECEPTHTETGVQPGKYSACVEAAWPDGTHDTLWLGELVVLDAITALD